MLHKKSKNLLAKKYKKFNKNNKNLQNFSIKKKTTLLSTININKIMKLC